MPSPAPRIFAANAFAGVAFVAMLAIGSAAFAATEAGVASAVNPDAVTEPPQQTKRTLVVGHNVVFDEKITTGPLGQAQLLMLDQSGLTIAPNSELVIDKFVYDPDKKTGEMAMSLSRGLMRFVGGRLSKSGNVDIRTPVATMGIRGGVAMFDVVSPTTVDVTLLYGDGVTGTTDTGQAFELRRTGYFTRIETGKGASEPRPNPGIAQALARLQGRAEADGGADEKPTDEGASASIGDGALGEAAPPDFDFDVDPIAAGPDTKTLVDSENGFDETVLDNTFDELALDIAAAKRGEVLFAVTARLLTVIGGIDDQGNQFEEESFSDQELTIDPNDFQAGDRIFSVIGANGQLLSLANGAPLSFVERGSDDPDNVSNIFDATDTNTYISPTTYNASLSGDAATVLAGRNDFGAEFFNYDLTTADFDGVNGARLTLTGGVGVTANPGGRSFFEANGDSQFISLLPFSQVGRAQLPSGGGLAGIEAIDQADIAETPVMVDWNTGKLLYIGGVFQNIDGSQEKPIVYGIQAVVGTLTTDDDGNLVFVGQNAGSSHIDIDSIEGRLFHAGDAQGTPLGNPFGDFAISLDGDADAVISQTEGGARPGPTNTIFHQFGKSTTPISLGAAGSGTVTESLYSAVLLADVDGELEAIATDPDVGGVGTLTINRSAMELTTRFVGADDSNGVEVFTTAAANSAFFDNDHFAAVGQEQGANPGLVMVSANAVGFGDACACNFMHWGFWAGGDVAAGEAANAVSDIGVFFAGVETPNIDMPISGSATFRGQAFASMTESFSQNPRFQTGDFTLSTNFALGRSTGAMSLGARDFNIVGEHTVGQARLAVDYLDGGRLVGDGRGAFFGPNANNVGVTINIDDGAGLKATGGAVGER